MHCGAGSALSRSSLSRSRAAACWRRVRRLRKSRRAAIRFLRHSRWISRRRLISICSSVGWSIIAARNTTPTLRRCCMRPNNGSRRGRRRWPNRPSFWTSTKRRCPTGAESTATNSPISSRGLARSISAASAATCNGSAASVRLRSSRRLTYTNPHAVRTWRSHAGLWTCFSSLDGTRPASRLTARRRRNGLMTISTRPAIWA